MKLLRLILLLPACFLPALLAGESGTISIISQPPGCWVRIDSVLAGKTPLEGFSMPSGAYTVQVYPPEQGVWNLQEQVFEVVIRAQEDTALEVVFSAPVFINSVPYGAQLLGEAGLLLGMTPLYLPFEENRGKQFRLEKAGYKPYRFSLNSRESVLAYLEKDKKYAADDDKPGLFGLVSKKHLKSKFSLLALSVASHWASFYFKNLADSNYENYRQSADPAQIDYFWDRTKKFDRYSEISLAVSYVSLAGLMYLVIWK